jgi:hypothetical protein
MSDLFSRASADDPGQAGVQIDGHIFFAFQMIDRIKAGDFFGHGFHSLAISMARLMSASCVLLSPPASRITITGPLWMNTGGNRSRGQRRIRTLIRMTDALGTAGFAH